MPSLLPITRAEGEPIIQAKFDVTFHQLRENNGEPVYARPQPGAAICGTVSKHTTILWERGVMRVFQDPLFKWELTPPRSLVGWLTYQTA